MNEPFQAFDSDGRPVVAVGFDYPEEDGAEDPGREAGPLPLKLFILACLDGARCDRTVAQRVLVIGSNVAPELFPQWKTQDDVARALGISRQRVGTILRDFVRTAEKAGKRPRMLRPGP
jgi:hypothetical protein